jgi:heme-degrading monooxygenase HmoA/uncharacterized protein YciI
MHYLLFYEVSDDHVAKRAKFRDEHLAKAWQASQRGELVLGGALANPIDGAVLLFKGDSPRVAEDFAKADPYVTSGTVKRWYVREWTTVAGVQAAMPVKPVGHATPADTHATPADTPTPVLRLWKGRSTLEKAGDYIRHATENVFPQLDSIPGHRGAQLLRRSVDNGIEFVVLTFWESMDAVRKFAGANHDNAVVEPAARAALTDYDRTVVHFEVIYHSGEGAQSGLSSWRSSSAGKSIKRNSGRCWIGR